ncbi:hypothetical protein LTR94_029429, partial [Friedmanniomyces endolithicus]
MAILERALERATQLPIDRVIDELGKDVQVEEVREALAGQIVIETAPFDLAETVRGAAALYRPRADEKGVALRVQIEPALDRAVEGDVVRLRQVLSNLISNALKFTDGGSVTVSVADAGADRVRFTVADTGCGFDDAHTTRIFARFQQADGSITRRFGGTGLGLSICQRLVQMMDGELELHSTLGEGTRAEVRLSLVEAGSSDVEALVAEQEQAAIDASGAIDKIVQSINDETAALGVLNPVQRELLNYREQLAALSPEERAAAEA